MKEYDNNNNNNEELLNLEEEMASALDATPKIDEDEADLADSYELPDNDLSNETLDSHVTPKKNNEFTCSMCNLVLPKRNQAKSKEHQGICIDCEADL